MELHVFSDMFSRFDENVLNTINTGSANMISLISPLVAACFSLYVLLVLVSYWRGHNDSPIVDFLLRMAGWVPVARHEDAIWSLSFAYPDTQAKQSAAAAVRSAEARALLAQTVDTRGTGNADYDMHGDTVLAPTALWDDGRFTYFEFRTNRDLPQIYRVYGDNKEALVNPDDVRGPVLVVHDTAQRFNLRLGDAVLGIRNNAYRPDGQLNPAGTTVPGTVRLVKHKEAGDDQ